MPEGREGLIWFRSGKGSMGGSGHSHDDLELNVQMRGSASYICDNRRYHMRSHAIVWLPPRQEHILLDVSPDHEMWIAIVNPSLLHRVCTAVVADFLTGITSGDPFCRHIAPESARELNGLFGNLATVRDDPHRFNAGLAYGVLTAWAAFGGAEINAEVFEVHPAVGRAMELLRRDGAPPRLEALAHQVGLNQALLSQLFKEQLGISIIDFRNRECLSRFFEIYRQGRRKGMRQAAAEAGFGSYQQFYRVVVQQTGRGPQEYAREARKRGIDQT